MARPLRAADVVPPAEVTKEGARPVLVEKGPYSYVEYTEKFEIEFSHGGDQVEFYSWTVSDGAVAAVLGATGVK